MQGEFGVPAPSGTYEPSGCPSATFPSTSRTFQWIVRFTDRFLSQPFLFFFFFSFLNPVPRSWKSQEGPSPGDSGRTSALGPLDLRRLVHRIQTGGLSCVSLCGLFLVCFLYHRCPVPPNTHTDTDPYRAK